MWLVVVFRKGPFEVRSRCVSVHVFEESFASALQNFHAEGEIG